MLSFIEPRVIVGTVCFSLFIYIMTFIERTTLLKVVSVIWSVILTGILCSVMVYNSSYHITTHVDTDILTHQTIDQKSYLVFGKGNTVFAVPENVDEFKDQKLTARNVTYTKSEKNAFLVNSVTRVELVDKYNVVRAAYEKNEDNKYYRVTFWTDLVKALMIPEFRLVTKQISSDFSST